MGKMGNSNRVIWMVMSMLLNLFFLNVRAQPGFLSISCGAKGNQTDQNNITWVPDDNYIDVGDTSYVGDASQGAYGSYLHTLRFFPKPLNKSCYQLPVTPNVPYLLRIWSVIGNYTGSEKFADFSLSVETPGLLFQADSAIKTEDPYGLELIFVSVGRVLYICLIRTSETHDPFISAIELRTLQKGMYPQAKPGTALWILARKDVGGNSWLRYPQDNFDRVWHVDVDNSSPVRNVSSQQPIPFNNTENLVPNAVIQTAWVPDVDSFAISLGTFYGQNTLLMLYFAELERLKVSESRSFYVTIHGNRRSNIINLVPYYSAVEITVPVPASDETADLTFSLVKAANSTIRPIINAYEYYLLIDTELATYSQDMEVIGAIKRRFDIKDWISDPCYLIPWNGIHCDNGSSAIRISEINLSGRNLRGPVPEDIGHLTALVTVSLDNNHLIGSLPNFSRLTMLERLHLQNNRLNGSLPDWLSKLKNLKELFIENNNFSGVIPAELLYKPKNLLKFRYYGNNDLCVGIDKGKCIKEIQESGNISRKGRVNVILAVTISAGLIVALGLVVGIAVYRKKFRAKQRPSEVNPIMMPNRAISRAFTLEEMIAATENFSRKIGEGGFGSVFLGKLPNGKEIAVKVLSFFSRQGVHQFQNEVDLLSKVHHKKLVALLGYCSESRDLMLIYEYMAGGSLRDRLYGTSPELSELSWKARLNIALDAAQGLEYLHVGCTPKIIHRDVKSANILLDSSLNGKLADFGLSKMTSEGEVTHVTTTVKGTPGYLDPEYFRTHQLTEKSDVYSFGVVLLEIVCGRSPINAHLTDDELNLIQWVRSYVERNENPGEIEEIADKRLSGSYCMESITSIVKVALTCVEPKPSFRPTMGEIVGKIKEALFLENGNNSPLPEPERTRTEFGDILVRGDTSRPEYMEWGDNSSNIPHVGR
eukprot:PITA_16644